MAFFERVNTQSKEKNITFVVHRFGRLFDEKKNSFIETVDDSADVEIILKPAKDKAALKPSPHKVYQAVIPLFELRHVSPKKNEVSDAEV